MLMRDSENGVATERHIDKRVKRQSCFLRESHVRERKMCS